MQKGKRYKTFYFPALTIVATVITLLLIIAFSTYHNLSRERGRIEDMLLRDSLLIVRAIEASVRADLTSTDLDVSRIQKILEEVSREPSIASILLFDGNGDIVAAGPKGAQEEIKDFPSLALLLREKGTITRYQQASGGERVFEVIEQFYPLSYKSPPALLAEAGKKPARQEESLQGWVKDKVISIRMHPDLFEKARAEDIRHALLMGAILVILGMGALYFIFIVQNYYLVDRSLAHMKTYTENVVESVADGLISIDTGKKIVTLNRRAREILEAAEEELRGKNIAEILGENIETLLGTEDQSTSIHDYEIEVHHRSGREIPLSLSAAPLKDEMGREMGSVLLLRDLREIRDLQEKVRRSDRLASLGRFAAGVAHEIRNPLSSIRGFAQYFLHRFKGKEEEQGYASIMVKEVDRLNRVITELLDFARPKEPHRESHSLENILEHSLRLLEPELARKKVEIEKEYEPNAPPALVDRDQISQAFLNLLLNSIESIDGAGRIRIRLKKDSLQPALEVAIADTGRGIPQEHLGKVFEPFFSTKRKGTGLGLAIVHQIVESHGGDILVESWEGVGTTFRVILPVNGPNSNHLGPYSFPTRVHKEQR